MKNMHYSFLQKISVIKLILTSFILIFSMNLILALNSWIAIRGSEKKGARFRDLDSVISSAECYSIVGNKVFSSDNLSCGGYLYGSKLLNFLNVVNVKTDDVFFLGYLNLVSISVTFAVFIILFHDLLKLDYAILASFVLSPPIWFLIERSNIDSFIFFLLSISFIFLIKQFYLLPIGLISLTVLFKFYTFPVLICLLIFRMHIFTRLVLVISILVTFLAIVRDLILIDSQIPFTTYTSFGLPAPGIYLERVFAHFSLGEITRIQIYIVGIFLYMLFTFIIWRNLPMDLFTGYTLAESRNLYIRQLVITTFGTVHVTCYILGMNYDYRLIFYAVALASIPFKDLDRNRRILIYTLSLTSLWFTSFSFGRDGSLFILASLVGDLSLAIITSIMSISLVMVLRSKVKGLFLGAKNKI